MLFIFFVIKPNKGRLKAVIRIKCIGQDQTAQATVFGLPLIAPKAGRRTPDKPEPNPAGNFIAPSYRHGVSRYPEPTSDLEIIFVDT